MRARAFALVLVFVGLAISCTRSGPSAPTGSPGPAPLPSIKQVAIQGLPDPLLFDIPSSVQAGRSYTLSATATFDDGSTREVTAVWSTTDAAIASFEANTLRVHQEGAVTIRLAIASATFSTSREVTVRSSAPIVREERSERISCDQPPPVCTNPRCWGPPAWLFPVTESGTIELKSAKNPGWGSPSNYVTQLSREGQAIKEWLLLPTNPFYQTATVPGGFMYLFTMDADVRICGDVAAVWTHPN